MGGDPSRIRRTRAVAGRNDPGAAAGGSCVLAKLALPEQRDLLTIRSYDSRQIIFREGAPAEAVYCLDSGAVKLSKVGHMGEELIIRVLGPGSLFGYRAVLAGETYAASAETIAPTSLCLLSRESFLDLIRRSPGASFDLLQHLAKELRISEEQMLAIAQQNVRQRTIRLLCSFLYASGGPPLEGSAIPIPLMRSEMAQVIGTTPETLSRTLRQLADEKVIRLTRSEVFVEHAKALIQLMSGPALEFDQDQV